MTTVNHTEIVVELTLSDIIRIKSMYKQDVIDNLPFKTIVGTHTWLISENVKEKLFRILNTSN